MPWATRFGHEAGLEFVVLYVHSKRGLTFDMSGGPRARSGRWDGRSMERLGDTALRKRLVHAEAGDDVAERTIERLGCQIAAKHVEGDPGQAHDFGQLLHLEQRCSAMAPPTMLWVDEELENKSHADVAPRQAAKPHEAEHRTRRMGLDLIEVMLGRCCLLWQKASKLRSGKRLGLMLAPAARANVVRCMRGDRDVGERIEPLRRHRLKDGHAATGVAQRST